VAQVPHRGAWAGRLRTAWTPSCAQEQRPATPHHEPISNTRHSPGEAAMAYEQREVIKWCQWPLTSSCAA
jgi:hypothetical protein